MNRNITATILIILAIGIYATVTRGKIDEIKSVQVVNAEYSTAIANAEKLIKVRNKVLEDFNAISEDDKARIDKMIPNTVDNIRLIIDLDSIGNKHGITLNNIRANANKSDSSSSGVSGVKAPKVGGSQNVIPTPTLDTVSVSFSVTASYAQFIDFLRDLEANLRIMDITKLTLTANDTGTYDFGVELRTYWLRQQ